MEAANDVPAAKAYEAEAEDDGVAVEDVADEDEGEEDEEAEGRRGVVKPLPDAPSVAALAPAMLARSAVSPLERKVMHFPVFIAATQTCHCEGREDDALAAPLPPAAAAAEITCASEACLSATSPFFWAAVWLTMQQLMAQASMALRATTRWRGWSLHTLVSSPSPSAAAAWRAIRASREPWSRCTKRGFWRLGDDDDDGEDAVGDDDGRPL